MSKVIILNNQPKIETNELYEGYKKRFNKMSDGQLVESFNHEVGNTGWTSARASYLSALHDEFNARGFDYSTIGDSKSLSLATKIKLVDKKIVILKVK